MSAQDTKNLLQAGHPHHFAKNDLLFAHGDPITHFYVIIQGVVKLFRENQNGQEKTIDILNPGQSICANEILDSCSCHWMNAAAVGDVLAMRLPASWLKEAIENYPILARNLLNMISEKENLAEVEAEHQANMSSAQLVACFTQRLCVGHGLNPEGFELPYSKTLIASRLGIELETFSRAASKIREHGINIQGAHVSINKPDAAAQYVCDFCSIASECTAHQELSKSN